MYLNTNKIILMIDCGEYYTKLEYTVNEFKTDSDGNAVFYIDGKSSSAITRVPKEPAKEQINLEFKENETDKS